MRMAIAPISSVSFKNNSGINFTSRVKNDSEGQEFVPSQRKGTTDLAKMPVIVLLAMTPALTEAKVPEKLDAGNIPPSAEMMYEAPEEDEDNFFIMVPKNPEVTQTRAPYGFESLKYENINMVHKFRGDGVEQNLLFTAKGTSNEVDFIYIIPTNTRGGKTTDDIPPMVHQLVYHDLGKDKEYCGAIIEEDIIEKGTGKYKGTMRSEMRLPDETAQKIIDLVTGHSKFKNNTIVKIKETTSPMLMPPKIYE